MGGRWVGVCRWWGVLFLALLLAACSSSSSGGGQQDSVGGSAVKGVVLFALVSAVELAPNGSEVQSLGSTVTDGQGRYSLPIPSIYGGGPILLTLSDNNDPAQPTMVKCDVDGGCGSFAFGDPMPIGSLEMTALLPEAPGGPVSMQITPLTHAEAQAALNLGTDVDAALVNALHQALTDLLGVDPATIRPVDLTDPAAVAAASVAERTYAYLAAGIGNMAFNQSPFSSADNPMKAAVDALANSFPGGVIPYDDGGDPDHISVQELFSEAQSQAEGDGDVGTALSDADAAASGGDHDLLPDTDGDGTRDYADACPLDDQNDADADGVCGDVDNCPGFDDHLDADLDGVPDDCDLCPDDPTNDADGDGVCGAVDACPGFDDNVDTDGDGVPDGCDVCPDDAGNDADNDGICAGTGFKDPKTGDGDACPFDASNDADGDEVCGDVDNCPLVANADQANADGDARGDACDACPADTDNDSDGDGICVGADFQSPATGGDDNCPTDANTDQTDTDEDGAGDGCDVCPNDPTDTCGPPDADGDGVPDDTDNCPDDANPDQADTDEDGIGDACELTSANPLVSIAGAVVRTVVEGATLTVQVVLSLPTADHDVTVTLEAIETGENPATRTVDYDFPDTVVIHPYQNLASLDVTTVVDTVPDENDEQFVLAISTVDGGTVDSSDYSVQVEILNNDVIVGTPEVNFSAIDANRNKHVVENVGTESFEVKLSGPTDHDVTVTFEAGGSDTATVPDDLTYDSTLVIPTGDTSGQLVVTVNDDELEEDTEIAILHIAGATGATVGSIPSATLEILDNDNPALENRLTDPNLDDLDPTALDPPELGYRIKLALATPAFLFTGAAQSVDDAADAVDCPDLVTNPVEGTDETVWTLDYGPNENNACTEVPGTSRWGMYDARWKTDTTALVPPELGFVRTAAPPETGVFGYYEVSGDSSVTTAKEFRVDLSAEHLLGDEPLFHSWRLRGLAAQSESTHFQGSTEVFVDAAIVNDDLYVVLQDPVGVTISTFQGFGGVPLPVTVEVASGTFMPDLDRMFLDNDGLLCGVEVGETGIVCPDWNTGDPGRLSIVFTQLLFTPTICGGLSPGSGTITVNPGQDTEHIYNFNNFETPCGSANLDAFGGPVVDLGLTFDPAEADDAPPWPLVAQPLLPPTELVAEDNPGDVGGVIKLTWTLSLSPGVAEQRIYRATASGGPYTLLATIPDATTATYADFSDVVNGTAYYYVIRTFNGVDESADSNVAAATAAPG